MDSWFDCDFDKDVIFEDEDLFIDYLNKQEIDFDDYLEFLNGNINDNLKGTDVFKQYFNENKSEAKIKAIEKDKLLFFLLLKSQNDQIVIVNAPSTSAEKKKFLGYEWSTRKGSEGIKYLGANNDDSFSKNKGINNIKTPLFNPLDLDDEEKINSVIKQNFKDDNLISNDNVHYVDSTDLISFDGSKFTKSFNLNIRKTKKIKSKYPLKFLNEILINTNDINNIDNKVPNNEVSSEGAVPVVSQNKELFIDGYTNNYEPISNVPLIVFGDHTCCFKYVDFEFVRGADGTQILLTNEDEVRLKYLYYLSSILDIENSDRYVRHFKYLKNTKVPIPPISIQDNIVNDCLKIENESGKIRSEIDDLKKQINQLFMTGESSESSTKLNDSNLFNISIGNRVLSTELVEDGSIDVISANVNEPVGKINKEIIDDYSAQYILWGIDGEWMVRTTNVNEKFYPTDHCGYIKVLSDDINPKYLAKIIEKEGFNLRFSRTNRASIERISNIEISYPSIEEQNRIINKITEIENKIFELENNLDNLKKEQEDILINVLEIEYTD